MGKGIFKKGHKQAKKISLKFVVDCKLPIEDNVIVLNDFEGFLKQRIKVDGKAGNLGNSVNLTKDSSSIIVNATIPFSKRYLKYLTKKYLKKNNLRDWPRVAAMPQVAFVCHTCGVDIRTIREDLSMDQHYAEQHAHL